MQLQSWRDYILNYIIWHYVYLHCDITLNSCRRIKLYQELSTSRKSFRSAHGPWRLVELPMPAVLCDDNLSCSQTKGGPSDNAWLKGSWSSGPPSWCEGKKMQKGYMLRHATTSSAIPRASLRVLRTSGNLSLSGSPWSPLIAAQGPHSSNTSHSHLHHPSAVQTCSVD